MTTRSRSLLWLVAALASVPSPSRGQDTPLYRDPSPTEGPRIGGPLLSPMPPRPGMTPPPPPPSDLGPFQPSNPGPAGASPEVPRDPLLGIPPMPPPLPAIPMPPVMVGGDVQIKRKTTIRPPNGPIGRCHEWFHAALFGSHKDPVPTSHPKRGFFGWFSHATEPEGDASTRVFKWPAWPSWPLQDGH